MTALQLSIYALFNLGHSYDNSGIAKVQEKLLQLYRNTGLPCALLFYANARVRG